MSKRITHGGSSKRRVHMEGGGDHHPALASECRQAMSKLLKAAGIGRPPAVVVGGGRSATYRAFCNALEKGDEDAWLLVDAEDLPTHPPKLIEEDDVERVEGGDPWAHVEVRKGDEWKRPEGATDEQLHLMSVAMETWLLSDPDALRRVFGPALDRSKLPEADASLERLTKDKVNAALAKATAGTPSGAYGKGKHSFKVLAALDPARLRKLLWARRFLDAMQG